MEKAPKSGEKPKIVINRINEEFLSNNYYKVKARDSNGDKIPRTMMENPGAIVLQDGSLRLFLSVGRGGNIYSLKPVEPLPLE